MAQRPNSRRLSQRESLDTMSQPEPLQPQQPIGPGGAGADMERFVNLMESVSPGLQEAARQRDEEQAKIQTSMAEADAVSEHIAGTSPDEVEKEAERFENPHYRDAWRAKRYKLFADEQAKNLQQEIEENKNRPDFDADQLWRERSQELLSQVPEEHRGMVADQIGAAHGTWRKNRREEAVKNQKEASIDTFMTDVDNHLQQLESAGVVPNMETMQAYMEDASELNIDESKARAIYLDWAGRQAVESGKPEFLAGLEELRNDPELHDRYMDRVEQAQAAKDQRLSVEEVALRDEYQTMAREGQFDMGHVREIANDEEARELWSEPQIVQMLAQSKKANADAMALQHSSSAWLRDPNRFVASFGEELSSNELNEVMESGLERLRDQHGPEKGFRIWAEKVAASGIDGIPKKLRQRMITQATMPDMGMGEEGLRANTEELGQAPIPDEFQESYQFYRTLRQEVAGGDALVARMFDSGGNARAAGERLDLFHSLRESGMEEGEAYRAMNRLVSDAVPLEQFRNDRESRDAIENALDEVEDFEVFPGEARGKVREYTLQNGRLGMPPEMAAELAVDRYKRNHEVVRGAQFYHGGDTTFTDGLDEAIDWLIDTKQDRIREAAGDPNMSMDEIHVRQDTENPKVFWITGGTGTELNIPAHADRVKELYQDHRSGQAQEEAQRQLEMNQRRRERRGPGYSSPRSLPDGFERQPREQRERGPGYSSPRSLPDDFEERQIREQRERSQEADEVIRELEHEGTILDRSHGQLSGDEDESEGTDEDLMERVIRLWDSKRERQRRDKEQQDNR